MNPRKYILVLAGAAMLLLALFLMAGCGGDAQSTSAYKCDLNEPSIIPPPSGKPQVVYFYKDT